MKTCLSRIFAPALLLGLMFSPRAYSAESDGTSPVKNLANVAPEPPPQTLIMPTYKQPVPIYQPPPDSGYGLRINGVVRGGDATTPTLSFLAPDHVGLTTKESPSLFWYQSKPAKTKFELTIIEDGKADPLLEVKLDRSANDGVQRIKLSDYGVKLGVGVQYRCTVALVVDEENRSRDIVASGVIKRIEPKAKLTGRLAKARSADLPFIFAEEGIWYDAMESLADLIDANPDTKAFYTQRAALLEQVKLTAAAASDMKFAGR